MERFIVKIKMVSRRPVEYLKSSMERFIDFKTRLTVLTGIYLKSSMERFIEITARRCDYLWLI